MTILNKIIRAKHKEIIVSKQKVPLRVLEKGKYFSRKTCSLESSLRNPDKFGIIAEFKRLSPSRGIINAKALPELVCSDYFNYGASAVSVLTDSEFFGGSVADLVKVRDYCHGPILRKEFIIDEYQVVESKCYGADAILLIVDVLNRNELAKLYSLAKSFDLDVLFEIHDITGIEKLPDDSRIIGINSRDLNTFSVNTDKLKEMIEIIPATSIKIAESGIQSPQTFLKLREEGFTGFLIGEMFMKHQNPGEALREFINNIKHKEG